VAVAAMNGDLLTLIWRRLLMTLDHNPGKRTINRDVRLAAVVAVMFRLRSA